MTNFTAIGNVTAEPEYNAQHRRLTFTVAHTEREKRNGEWTDSDPIFVRCTAWRSLADNLFEGRLSKGDRVVMAGDIKGHMYEVDGGKRYSVEMNVTDGGKSFLFAPRPPPSAHAPAPAADPWGDVPPPTQEPAW